MSDTGNFITRVSDTARWTALHRATESARADALFSDQLAERLAGEHGHPGNRLWSAVAVLTH